MSQTLVVLHLRAQGLEEGDEHPPMLSCGAWLTLPYLYSMHICTKCNMTIPVNHGKWEGYSPTQGAGPGKSMNPESALWLHHHFRQGGYVFIGICLFVCKQDHAGTTSTNFHRIRWKCVTWATDEIIRFW